MNEAENRARVVQATREFFDGKKRQEVEKLADKKRPQKSQTSSDNILFGQRK